MKTAVLSMLTLNEKTAIPHTENSDSSSSFDGVMDLED
jgi:hypothetical protein